MRKPAKPFQPSQPQPQCLWECLKMSIGSGAGETIDKMLTGIFLIAIISVVLSKSATTVALVSAVSKAFSQVLGVVVSPVTGNNSSGLGNILGAANPIANLVSNIASGSLAS
jgi:hypothetical protein